MKVVVTGGAGFIGSHLVDALAERGHAVRVVDSLDAQVHPSGRPPEYLDRRAEFVKQDIRDREGLARAIAGAEAVFHLAGMVGVGDSMYRIRDYAEANVTGAANLLDILANTKHRVGKVVVASSVTVYGEGKYRCERHGEVYPEARDAEALAKREWEPRCVTCDEPLTPMATDERKPAMPLSVYAATKRAQEEMFLAVGRAYGIATVALRYFNVYGTRQAASNPYTGVAKIFAQHFAEGRPPVIYEDGMQTRDFVHVSDVTQANVLALEREEANGEIFNVGAGRGVTIWELARAVGEGFGARGRAVTIAASEKYRAGDVRHCWANITKIRTRLGFEPRKVFPAGLEDLMAAAKSGGGAAQTDAAHGELAERGLIS